MKIIAQNKKAHFNYFLEDSYEAGIVLKGSEIKSIRDGKCSLVDSYVSLANGELWLKNCEIATYSKTSAYQLDPRRERKLLVKSAEINKIKHKLLTKGYTLIPTRLYLNSSNLAKLEFALAKGKQLFDKKEAIKERDLKRELKKVF